MTPSTYADWITAAISASVRDHYEHQAELEAAGLPPIEGRGYLYSDVPADLGKPDHVRTARLEIDSTKRKRKASLLVALRDGSTERYPVDLW